MTSRAILLFVSWVCTTQVVQDPDQFLRAWAAAGQADAIRKLLAESEEVDIGARDDDGWTALMHAAEAGHEDVVELLLDAGANVHSENNTRDTALHHAAEHGRTEVARLLLEAGADFAARDAEGRTPLYRAFEHRHGEVTDLLQAAAQAEADRRASVEKRAHGEETLPPKMVRSVPAPYTSSGLKQGIEGTVVLMVLVRRDGSVGPVNVSKSLEESLDRSAVRAVKKWKFEPATRHGEPVEIVVEVTVDFELPEKR